MKVFTNNIYIFDSQFFKTKKVTYCIHYKNSLPKRPVLSMARIKRAYPLKLGAKQAERLASLERASINHHPLTLNDKHLTILTSLNSFVLITVIGAIELLLLNYRYNTLRPFSLKLAPPIGANAFYL